MVFVDGVQTTGNVREVMSEYIDPDQSQRFDHSGRSHSHRREPVTCHWKHHTRGNWPGDHLGPPSRSGSDQFVHVGQARETPRLRGRASVLPQSILLLSSRSFSLLPSSASSSMYNLLKKDKTNHRRERDKGHITREGGRVESFPALFFPLICSRESIKRRRRRYV